MKSIGYLLQLRLPHQNRKEQPMDAQIVAIYCLCDDILKGLHHHEDIQCQMSDAEVMTTSVVAATFFAGNIEKSRCFLKEHGYIPNMLEKSHFNRRQHRIAELFLIVFDLLGNFWKELNEQSVYILGSFPLAACDNYRIQRSHRYSGEVWHGCQSSKRRYFYGLKLHLVVTEHGQPVEFFLTSGSWSDTKALKMYRFDLPEGALITGYKAYNDYALEDLMMEARRRLLPLRKKSSKRPLPHTLLIYRPVTAKLSKPQAV
jgi:DDE family transposase